MSQGRVGPEINQGFTQTCMLCGKSLKNGWWCNACQLSSAAIANIFSQNRLEEARTPCGPLIWLAMATVAGLILWAALLR